MHITLQPLKFFEAMARDESISPIAAECHLTPPSLSTPIKPREAQIGLPLREQRRKRVALTDGDGAQDASQGRVRSS